MCIYCGKSTAKTAETIQSQQTDELDDNGFKNKLAKMRQDLWSIRKSISIINHAIVGCVCSADNTTKTLENFVGDIRASIKAK